MTTDTKTKRYLPSPEAQSANQRLLNMVSRAAAILAGFESKPHTIPERSRAPQPSKKGSARRRRERRQAIRTSLLVTGMCEDLL
jgi:hypothetical protein